MKVFQKILVLLVASMGLSGVARPDLSQRRKAELWAKGKYVAALPIAAPVVIGIVSIIRGLYSAGSYTYTNIIKVAANKILAVPGVGFLLGKGYKYTLGNLFWTVRATLTWLGWQTIPWAIVSGIVIYAMYVRAQNQEARDRNTSGGRSHRRLLY